MKNKIRIVKNTNPKKLKKRNFAIIYTCIDSPYLRHYI